jgi:hypothetical protein
MASAITYKHGFPKLSYSQVPYASGSPFQRAPTTSDIMDPKAGSFYQIGTLWPDTATSTMYMLTAITASSATWQALTGAAAAVVGPASSTINAIARFDGTTGKLLQNSAVTVADTTGVMTFAAGGGNVLTAGGAATRKGQTTLVAGASPAIATTSVAALSVIAIAIASLGTVTAPKPMYVTITPGTSFIITSSDATDTSVINWAIVA